MIENFEIADFYRIDIKKIEINASFAYVNIFLYYKNYFEFPDKCLKRLLVLRNNARLFICLFDKFLFIYLFDKFNYYKLLCLFDKQMVRKKQINNRIFRVMFLFFFCGTFLRDNFCLL